MLKLITQYGTAETAEQCLTHNIHSSFTTYCNVLQTVSVPHNKLRHLALKLENEKKNKILTFIVVKLDTGKPPSHQNNNHRDRF